ncbi:HupE/UreJ family protein [Tranquillimonas alkanivorans]|uniref:HupE / UreJ protein n=1 Tax=Tranquillimonas alkanivorans TaxID=441119 RepID=A0A1I5KH75_9RHOB|nr:HupE/UreJ family protein [Tranquillimonas alkanivorans]SFO83986.1 HupE / UreJ protein [Tranquillimonas alkanivorans]
MAIIPSSLAEGRVWRGALLSSLLLALLTCWASVARAHEVQPAVADVWIEGDALRMELKLTLEPLMAGIDLEGLDDTNASDRTEANDALRTLAPNELETRFEAYWPELRDDLQIRSDGERVVPRLGGVDIPKVGDPGLPRLSRLRLTADLPPGDAPVTVAWPATNGALVVRQMAAGPDGYSAYLDRGAESAPMPRTGTVQQSSLEVFTDYVVIGFAHIIPKGLDHILFVLGLFFLSQRLGPLLWQVSAFTVAHTVTLALGILGLVSVPAYIVEPLIAASIAYVGIENVLSRGMNPWRPVVVFAFGLLHGLGFASVLGEIGLNPAQFVTGLIGFNVGVELGQLAVIALAFLAVGVWSRNRTWYRSVIANPASIAIALVGAYWAVERTLL